MKFAKTNNGFMIPVFTPSEGITIPAGAYAPIENEVLRLATDMLITLDGVDVLYEEGKEVCLIKGVTYTLSGELKAHRM